MSTPSEIRTAAIAYDAALTAREDAQAAFQVVEALVQAAVTTEQAAFDAAAAGFAIAAQAYETAVGVARTTVPGWAAANAALSTANTNHANARSTLAEVAAAYDGS